MTLGYTRPADSYLASAETVWAKNLREEKLVRLRRATPTQVERLAKDLGADLLGVADLTRFKPYNGVDNSLLTFPFGISLGVRLSNSIISRITVADPTPEYAHHYKAVNALLDDIALRIVNRIQAQGYAALPIAASHVTNRELHQGAISHKAVAALAGLGWIGKSQLLVNPKLGPRLRLASILTTIPSTPGIPLENRCGECDVCIRACPTHAIKSAGIIRERWVREEVFDPNLCHQRLTKFRDDPRYGASVCGICVKVCPIGVRKAGER